MLQFLINNLANFQNAAKENVIKNWIIETINILLHKYPLLIEIIVKMSSCSPEN